MSYQMYKAILSLPKGDSGPAQRARRPPPRLIFFWGGGVFVNFANISCIYFDCCQHAVFAMCILFSDLTIKM